MLHKASVILFLIISVGFNDFLMASSPFPKSKSSVLRNSAIKMIESDSPNSSISGVEEISSGNLGALGNFVSYGSWIDLDLLADDNLSNYFDKVSPPLSIAPLENENDFSSLRSKKERRSLNNLTSCSSGSLNGRKTSGRYSPLAVYALSNSQKDLWDSSSNDGNSKEKNKLVLQDYEDEDKISLKDDSLVNFMNSEGFPMKKKDV